MKLTNEFKAKILDAIRSDPCGWEGDDDWWTSYTDEKGRIFDINVYDNLYNPSLSPLEVAISVYDVEEVIDGEGTIHYDTDFEGSEYDTFTVTKSELTSIWTQYIDGDKYEVSLVE